MSDPIGRQAAYLKWACGLSWNELAQTLDAPRERLRSAARKYRDDHRREFAGKPVCPADLAELARAATGREPLVRVQTEVPGEFIVDGNEAELTYTATTSGPIKSLDDLVREHRIDLAVWSLVGDVLHNAWSVARARHGGPGFEWFQNHQVKASFARKHPEPVFPAVQPVRPAARIAPPDPTPALGVLREVIFGDVHIGFRKCISTARLTPFHDRRALDILLQVVRYVQPDAIHNLGDFLDATELSAYAQEEAFYFTFQPALLEGFYWHQRLREAAPRAQITYHEGNHEERLTRGLLVHYPAAHSLSRASAVHMGSVTSIAYLMALDDLAVRWEGGYPKAESWSADLRIRHGDIARKDPGATARAYIAGAQADEAFGHIHRPELVGRVLYGREGRHGVKAFSPGCLCRVDGEVPGSSPDNDWRQGFVVRDFVPEGKLASETFVTIEDGRAVFDGKLWLGREERAVTDLEKMFSDWGWSSEPGAGCP